MQPMRLDYIPTEMVNQSSVDWLCGDWL